MNRISKERLKAVYLIESKQKWPSLPDHCRIIKLPSDSTTNGLTQCVIKWIQLNGHHAERISNTGRMIDTSRTVTNVVGQTGVIGGKKWIKGTGTNGTADISAIVRTKSGQVIPWKIEIKFGKDRQSEAQKQYESTINKVGGRYSIVRDFDGFLEEWDSLNLE
jgi:hypothetical protein